MQTAADTHVVADKTIGFFQVEKPKNTTSALDILKHIRAANGGSNAFLFEFVKLSRRPSRMLIQEYAALRLWDKSLYPDADLKAFVGFLGMRDIYLTANYDLMLHGIMQSKLAANATLAAHGLPVIETLHLHAADSRPGERQTATPDALADRLLHLAASQPLFGKPLHGLRSLGTIALTSANAMARTVTTTDGRSHDVDQFATALHDAYAETGYLIQPMMRPHDLIGAICGSRLATVRVLTAVTEAGPTVLRACWKIPGGDNQADNYWRTGNLIAGVNIETGQLSTAMSGVGFTYREYENHPDSGAPLRGTYLPGWEAICETALAGARVMKGFHLVGWDIALTQTGPVIVEMNETPDLAPHQLADKRGILDARFGELMRYWKQKAATDKKKWQRESASEIAISLV